MQGGGWSKRDLPSHLDDMSFLDDDPGKYADRRETTSYNQIFEDIPDLHPQNEPYSIMEEQLQNKLSQEHTDCEDYK